MAHVEVTVGLRFVGQDVNPELVTSLLSISPTRQHRRGDPKPRRPGESWLNGYWSLDGGAPASGPLAARLDQLLDLVDPHAEQVKKLRSRGHHGDLFCGIFTEGTNFVFDLPSSTLARISAFGFSVTIDVYCGTEGDEIESVDGSSQPIEA